MYFATSLRVSNKTKRLCIDILYCEFDDSEYNKTERLYIVASLSIPNIIKQKDCALCIFVEVCRF